LLSDADYVHDKYVDVKGVFDVQSHKLPVSKVSVQSPHFQCNELVVTDAAVCEQLSSNIDCIVGNALFSEFSQLHDVINLRQQSGSDLITDGDRNTALDTDIDLPTVDSTDTHTGTATDTGRVCSSQNSQTVEMINVTADSAQLTELADGISMSEGDMTYEINRDGVDCLLERSAVNNLTSSLTDSSRQRTAAAADARRESDTRSSGSVDCSIDTDDQVKGETETEANAVFTRRQTAATESGGLDDDAGRPDNMQAHSGECGESFEQVVRELGRINTAHNEQELNVNSDEFRKAQKNDTELADLWQKARLGSRSLVVRDGILYRRIEDHMAGCHKFALVLPRTYE